jgi:hypothetical protein
LVSNVVDKARVRFPELAVREWNLAEHPDLGPRYGVMATPAIVINGRLEFRGVPKEQAFLERLAAMVRTDGD